MSGLGQGGQKPPVQVPPVVQIPDQIPPAGQMPQIDPQVHLPPVPGDTTHPGRGVVTVSTQAIRTFATNMQLLEEPIRTALNGMNGVDVRAGAFNQAFVLAQRIEGDGELRDSTRTVLTKALNALVEIRQACNRLVAEYDTAEELNGADADRFGELVLGATTVINGMGGNH